ncbi:unnamed protein product [Peniophora sp. CBMAI 1063]|nr:unnamed protein product [Peniophora sp. CBMAI 1063]
MQARHALRKILSSEWARWPRYGEELVTLLSSSTIEPPVPASVDADAADTTESIASAVIAAAPSTTAPSTSSSTTRTSTKRPAIGDVDDSSPTQATPATLAKKRKTTEMPDGQPIVQDEQRGVFQRQVEVRGDIPVKPAGTGFTAEREVHSATAPPFVATTPRMHGPQSLDTPRPMQPAYTQPPYPPYAQYGSPSYPQYMPHGQRFHPQEAPMAYSPYAFAHHSTYVQAAHEQQAAQARAAYAQQAAYAAYAQQEAQARAAYAHQAAYARQMAYAQQEANIGPSPRPYPSSASDAGSPSGYVAPFMAPLLPEQDADQYTTYPSRTVPS